MSASDLLRIVRDLLRKLFGQARPRLGDYAQRAGDVLLRDLREMEPTAEDAAVIARTVRRAAEHEARYRLGDEHAAWHRRMRDNALGNLRTIALASRIDVEAHAADRVRQAIDFLEQAAIDGGFRLIDTLV